MISLTSEDSRARPHIPPNSLAEHPAGGLSLSDLYDARPISLSILKAAKSHLSGRNNAEREAAMLDIVFLATGFGFFAAAWLYLLACERL